MVFVFQTSKTTEKTKSAEDVLALLAAKPKEMRQAGMLDCDAYFLSKSLAASGSTLIGIYGSFSKGMQDKLLSLANNSKDKDVQFLAGYMYGKFTSYLEYSSGPDGRKVLDVEGLITDFGPRFTSKDGIDGLIAGMQNELQSDQHVLVCTKLGLDPDKSQLHLSEHFKTNTKNFDFTTKSNQKPSIKTSNVSAREYIAYLSGMEGDEKYSGFSAGEDIQKGVILRYETSYWTNIFKVNQLVPQVRKATTFIGISSSIFNYGSLRDDVKKPLDAAGLSGKQILTNEEYEKWKGIWSQGMETWLDKPHPSQHIKTSERLQGIMTPGGQIDVEQSEIIGRNETEIKANFQLFKNFLLGYTDANGEEHGPDPDAAFALLKPGATKDGFGADYISYGSVFTLVARSELRNAIKSAFSAGAVVTIGLNQSGTYRLQLGVTRNNTVVIINGEDASFNYTAMGIRVIGDILGKGGNKVNILVSAGAVYVIPDNFEYKGKKVDLDNLAGIVGGVQVGIPLTNALSIGFLADYQHTFPSKNYDKSSNDFVVGTSLTVGGQLLRRKADWKLQFGAYQDIPAVSKRFGPTLSLNLAVTDIDVGPFYLDLELNAAMDTRENPEGKFPKFYGFTARFNF